MLPHVNVTTCQCYHMLMLPHAHVNVCDIFHSGDHISVQLWLRPVHKIRYWFFIFGNRTIFILMTLATPMMTLKMTLNMTLKVTLKMILNMTLKMTLKMTL